MKSVSDEKKLKKINANLFSTKLFLLEEDIDPDANLFNETKFQKLDSLIMLQCN